jgi:hypothetical protein
MLATAWTGRRQSRPFATKFVALISAVLLALALGVTADAATTTKPYEATWVSGGSPLPVPPGSVTLTLRITNKTNPQTLGSANISPPPGYTLTSVAPLSLPASAQLDATTNTVKLRNLNLAPLVGVNVTISFTTPCLADGLAKPWDLIVKQANNFSGPPGNDFAIYPPNSYPSTVRAIGSACLLRFANQPNTTQTGFNIRDGYASTGNAIRVEIYDPSTTLTVNTNALVELTASGPAGGTLTGGASIPAVAGIATFGGLSINLAGPYKLWASSEAASIPKDSLQFMVSDTVTTCAGAGCNFPLTQGQNTYTTTPKNGASGATFVASLNLIGLRISCDFAPFNYPDSRQPNAVWYVYNDADVGNTGSAKTNVIVIDKAIVQVTPENGASAYRVCYSSPVRFFDRTGAWAPVDPWDDGPGVYFGTTWYTGLLPDCKGKNPVAPCVMSWTGDNAGNRVGTFLTPPGDPGFR